MKYKVVYADPPWSYDGGVMKTKTGDSTVDLQYDTMTDEQLLNFPIDEYADKDCLLFMWVTVPKLPLGIKLLDKWGFTYKTSLVWIKQYNKRGGHGQGTYFMIQTEYLLMATRGKIPQFHSGEDNYRFAEWRGHSTKPQQFRTLIENNTKNLEPKIELWARIKAVGWDVFGNDHKLNHKCLESFCNVDSKTTQQKFGSVM
jgi:N6-adenosine-specific RNA methylase IME4